MKLADIIQMQKDRSNGVVLSQISIDKLIGHALMREIEAERLTQALADSNLALMEQTEIAQAANRQAEVAQASADPIVEMNVAMLRERSAVGVKKYGVTMADSGLTHRQWLQHALEEGLDQVNYLQSAIQTLSVEPTAPQQHAQAVHQFRKAGAANWYDGHPDNEDGGGPYEVRTLYAQQHAQAAQTNSLTTFLQAAGAMRLVRCHDGSGEPFEAYDKAIADRVVSEQRAKVHSLEEKIEEFTRECERCDGNGGVVHPDGGSGAECVLCKGTGTCITGNAQAAQTDWQAFHEWAKSHLGQGYSLESDEGVFNDKVTRWCFNGFRAGRRCGILATRQPAPESISKAFVTLESTEGRYSIVMKFNQKADAFAVHDYLLGAGGRDYHAAPVAAAVSLRRFNWTQQGMEQAADGAYCYASETQRAASQPAYFGISDEQAVIEAAKTLSMIGVPLNESGALNLCHAFLKLRKPESERDAAKNAAIEKIVKAVDINDNDTLGSCAADEFVIWTASGSWNGSINITLGDMRAIAGLPTQLRAFNAAQQADKP